MTAVQTARLSPDRKFESVPRTHYHRQVSADRRLKTRATANLMPHRRDSASFARAHGDVGPRHALRTFAQGRCIDCNARLFALIHAMVSDVLCAKQCLNDINTYNVLVWAMQIIGKSMPNWPG